MRLIITDTNIFFDLISIGTLPEFFGLEMDICTTEFVINEIKPSKQRDQIEVFIRAHELTVFSFTSEELELIVNHDYKRSIKGITDKSIFWKSLQLKCPLLTGDKSLRNEAEESGVEVHGILWVIDILVTENKITNDQGIRMLEILKSVNPLLPIVEIEKQVKRYKNKPESTG